MAKMFEIVLNGGGTFDVTPFIVLNTYSVSSQPQYDEWVDGTNHNRRSIKSRKLEGTFSVKFFKQSDYASFLNAIETNRVAGYDYLIVHAYDNKKRQLIEGIPTNPLRMYMDYELPNLEPSSGWSFNEEIEIEVKEI